MNTKMTANAKMRMNTKMLVVSAMLTAVLFAGQVGMQFLPNIEIVTLLIILYTRIYGKRVFAIIYAFVLLEGLFYGFGIWWVSYLYIWSIFALIVLLIKSHSVILWSMVSGIFGLCFGFLCALPYFVTGGIGAGLAYWGAGLYFDLLHCAGNVLLCAVLYHPLLRILSFLAMETGRSMGEKRQS